MSIANLDKAVQEIINELMLRRKTTQQDVHQLKTRSAAKCHRGCVHSNADIIAALNPKQKRRLLSVLRRKTVRTISGVTVIAVMTKPYPCPQPEPCAYCPGGPTQGAPQSYTGYEPAALRGSQNSFDPYEQVKSGIRQL